MIYPDCAAGTKMIHDDSFSKSKENNMAADITNIYIYVYMYIYIYIVYVTAALIEGV